MTSRTLTNDPVGRLLAAMQTKKRLAHVRGYLELGMLTEAAAELGQIPKAEQDSEEVLFLRMALLQEQEAWPELSRVAGELARLTPKQAGVWITFAYATRRAESLDAAEAILLIAEQHHPFEATIQFNLGCYACQRGDLDAARVRIRRAISFDQKFAEAARTDPDLAPLRAADAAGHPPTA